MYCELDLKGKQSKKLKAVEEWEERGKQVNTPVAQRKLISNARGIVLEGKYTESDVSPAADSIVLAGCAMMHTISP